MTGGPPRPQQGDEHDLFVRYADRLRKYVSRVVRTTPEIVDDACAFAWMKLVTNQPQRETVFPWLCAVARHKALDLHDMTRRMVGVDPTLLAETYAAGQDRVETKQSMLELEERLSGLNERQRTMVFLHAAGWRYEEIAEEYGVSRSRVNAVLADAREKFRAMDLREIEPNGLRARRLRAIEDSPPPYIVASIGPQPRVKHRTGGQELLREWKRLVLQIEDYRSAKGITDRVLPLGREGTGMRFERLRAHINEYRRDRGLSVELEL